MDWEIKDIPEELLSKLPYDPDDFDVTIKVNENKKTDYKLCIGCINCGNEVFEVDVKELLYFLKANKKKLKNYYKRENN